MYAKLSNSLIDTIAGYVAEGQTVSNACALAGAGRSTYYTWLKRGEEDIEAGAKTLYATFAVAVTKAEAEAEKTFVQRVKTATMEHWQAAAWYLERKNPTDWGRKDRHEHSGEVSVIVKSVKGVSLDDL